MNSVTGGAVFSPDRRYRYLLTREWEDGTGNVNFIMLNPSTADAEVDDPTIRRCIGFAQRWGYRTLTVTNLFALRATDPRALQSADDPVGPMNNAYILGIEDGHGGTWGADVTILAWGNGGAYRGRGTEVARELVEWRKYVGGVFHLGLTKGGEPRHPLYIPADFEPQPWEGR